MTTTKSAPFDARQAQNVTSKLLQFLQEIHNQPKQPEASDLEHYFTRNFELISNGTTISHNLNEYTQRIEKLRNKYSKFKITTHDQLIVSDNRVALNYTLTLTPRSGGQTINVEIMTFATFEGERLSKWHQVAHEKGAGHWDL